MFADDLIARLTRRRAVAKPPSRQTPVVGIGHSHIRCVVEAAAVQGFPLKDISFWTHPGAIVMAEGKRRFSAEVEGMLQGDVVSFIGGSAHDMVGLPAHPRPFDFVLPSASHLPLIAGAEIIPVDAVRETVRQVAQEYLELMALLKRSAARRLFHSAPPPPFADGEAMTPAIPWGLFDAAERRVSPKTLRYKFWRLHCEILEDFCRRSDITYIPPPPEGADEEGFLRPGFYQDPGHANAAYGALVLQRIERALA